MTTAELILYACPTGELAAQLDNYFALSRRACGENAAHRYMPHITLTGFFHDLPSTVDFYVRQLDRVLAVSTLPVSGAPVTIKQIGFQPNFHMMEVESLWLKQLTMDFISLATTESRQEAIRQKDWLHLSLAYDFPLEHQDVLKRLAEETLHLDAQVGWELRFYERHPDNKWTCHGTWTVGSGS
jgi:ubiquitin-associated SH3 domain-containing protein